MSLAEAQQMVEMLNEVNGILSDIELKLNNFKNQSVEIEHRIMTFQEAVRLTWRMSALLNRLGLPREINEAIRVVTRLAYAVRMAYMSLMLLGMGTPYGMMAGLIGLGVVTASAGDWEMNMGG